MASIHTDVHDELDAPVDLHDDEDGIASAAAAMDVSMIPAEIWVHIFGQLTRAPDLAQVARTCRTFSVHALRLLYRDVAYARPQAIQQSMRVWRRVPSLALVPRKMTIGVADDLGRGPNEHPYTKLSLDKVRAQIQTIEMRRPRQTQWHGVPHINLQHPPQPQPQPQHQHQHQHQNQHQHQHQNQANFPFALHQQQHHVQPPAVDVSMELNHLRALGYMREKFTWMLDAAAYTRMLDVVSSFTNLNSLHFVNTILPYGLHQFLRSLPSLHTLHIHRCELLWKHAFDSEAADVSHDGLPLRELEIHCAPGVYPDEALREVAMIQLHRLAEARGLERLSVIWHPKIMGRWLAAMDARAVDRPSPIPALTHLRVRVEAFSGWSGEARRVLHTFLERQPDIRNLHIAATEDVALAISPDMLPNLKNVTARYDVAGMIMYGRKLERVDITDFDQPGPLLERLVNLDTRALTTLCLHGRRFEEEALQGSCHLFPALRELRFTWADGRPSEQLILSLGGLHLVHVPQLETLHVYASAPSYLTRSAIEDFEFQETLADAVKAWSRFCSKLREVQFDRDAMWRREDAGDRWAERKFEWSDGARVMLGGMRGPSTHRSMFAPMPRWTPYGMFAQPAGAANAQFLSENEVIDLTGDDE